MWISKKRYIQMRDDICILKQKIWELEKEKSGETKPKHKTSGYCKSCQNGIVTIERSPLSGISEEIYCKLDNTCGDYIERSSYIC